MFISTLIWLAGGKEFIFCYSFYRCAISAVNWPTLNPDWRGTYKHPCLVITSGSERPPYLHLWRHDVCRPIASSLRTADLHQEQTFTIVKRHLWRINITHHAASPRDVTVCAVCAHSYFRYDVTRVGVGFCATQRCCHNEVYRLLLTRTGKLFSKPFHQIYCLCAVCRHVKIDFVSLK